MKKNPYTLIGQTLKIVGNVIKWSLVAFIVLFMYVGWPVICLVVGERWWVAFLWYLVTAGYALLAVLVAFLSDFVDTIKWRWRTKKAAWDMEHRP